MTWYTAAFTMNKPAVLHVLIYTLWSSLPDEDVSRCCPRAPVKFPPQVEFPAARLHSSVTVPCYPFFFGVCAATKQTCCCGTACKQRCNRRRFYLWKMRQLRMTNGQIKHIKAKNRVARGLNKETVYEVWQTIHVLFIKCFHKNMEINTEHACLIFLPVIERVTKKPFCVDVLHMCVRGFACHSC